MNSPKRKLPTAPVCESLEGRQLLTAGPGFGMGMGMGMGLPSMGFGGPADVSATSGRFDRSDFSGDPGTATQTLAKVSTSGQTAPAGLSPTSFAQDSRMSGFGQRRLSQDGNSFAGPMGGFGDPNLMDSTSTDASSVAQTQLETDLQKLQTDQQAIHDKSVVTPVMEAKVRTDIKTIKGAENTPADPTALATLKTDQKAAFSATGAPTDAQMAQIQADQDAVYKSQGVSANLITLLDTDRAAIVTASNVNDADKATIEADQKAIQTDQATLKAAMPTPVTADPVDPSATTPADPATTTVGATTTTPATPVAPATDTATTPAAATTTATPVVTAAPQMMAPVTSHVTGRGLGQHRGGFGRAAHFRR